jgi:hypothetical protein
MPAGIPFSTILKGHLQGGTTKITSILKQYIGGEALHMPRNPDD